MSKKRAVMKFGMAGAVTMIYAGSVAKAFKEPAESKNNPREVAVAAAVMLAATWIAVLA